MYKRVLQPSPYQDLGTAEQIRIRNGFMLGVGFLNYERNRFVKPEHIMKQLCPYCFAPETTDHFFTRCPLYTAPRDELYKQWLRVYHPRDPNARLFSTIGLLREPNTKEDICKHAPIIKAVNVYIERALQLRRTMMDWKDEERDWEDDSEWKLPIWQWKGAVGSGRRLARPSGPLHCDRTASRATSNSHSRVDFRAAIHLVVQICVWELIFREILLPLRMGDILPFESGREQDVYYYFVFDYFRFQFLQQQEQSYSRSTRWVRRHLKTRQDFF
jgi:hypothetical protein